MKNTYLKLYEKQDKEAFPDFIKSLTEKDKRELISILKKIRPFKNDYIYTGTCLVCCQTAEEYMKLQPVESGKSEQLTELLETFCPHWFDEYIEKTEYVHLKYTLLRDWILKDLVHPSEKRIGELLAFSIYNNLISTEELEAYPITLQEHIWHVFEHGYVTEEKNKIFTHYINQGILDRKRVLKSSLTKGCRTFYQSLNPLPEEIKQHQPELFHALSDNDTLLVHIALQSILKIVEDDEFLINDFLLHILPVVYNRTKKVLNIALTVLEKVAEKWVSQRAETCKELLPVFLNKDEKIQKKAATILCRYGNTNDKELKEKLTSYLPEILPSIQNELKVFLKEQPATLPKTDLQVIPDSRISELNKIEPVETFENFLFYLSALPNSKEPYMWDMLPLVLKQFDQQITKENIHLLQTIFKSAYAKGFNPETGYFQNIYYLYLIEYGKRLQERYPEETDWLTELYLKQQEKERTTRYGAPLPLTPLKEWFGQKQDQLLALYKRIMYNWKTMVEMNHLPFLSTPTHTPCWIDASILIERMLQYQQHSHIPDQTDLELALSRCVIENKDEFIQQIAPLLTPPYFKPIEKWYNNVIPTVESYTQQIVWEVSSKKQTAEDYKERYPLSIQLPETFCQKDDFLYAIDKPFIGVDDLSHFLWFYPNTHEPIYAGLMKTHFRFSQIGTAETRDSYLRAIEVLESYKGEIGEMTGLFLASTLLTSNKNILDYGTAIWIEKTTQGKINNEQFGIILGKLLNGGWGPAKRLTDNIYTNLLNIDSLHNQALETLLTHLLAQITCSITNLNTLKEIYKEVTLLNQDK